MKTIVIAVQIEDENQKMPTISSVKMHEINQQWNLLGAEEVEPDRPSSGGDAFWHLKVTPDWQLSLSLCSTD